MVREQPYNGAMPSLALNSATRNYESDEAGTLHDEVRIILIDFQIYHVVRIISLYVGRSILQQFDIR